VIRLLFSFLAAVATLVVILYGLSVAIEPFGPFSFGPQTRTPAPEPDATADAPGLALPEASSPTLALGREGPDAPEGGQPAFSKRVHGHWLAGFEVSHLRIDGSTRRLWLTGRTTELWAVYSELLEAAEARSALYGVADEAPAHPWLCMEVELTGFVREEPEGAELDSFVVERVLDSAVLDLGPEECLR
jgi:hypothetical protein